MFKYNLNGLSKSESNPKRSEPNLTEIYKYMNKGEFFKLKATN